MKNIKVVIADDSVVYRSQIKKALESEAGIEVMGTASNGRIALDKMQQTDSQLLILDLEMPDMDGLATLQEMKKRGLKFTVLVFSSQSQRGAQITMDALRLGASDFVAKPSGDHAQSSGMVLAPDALIRDLLVPKIRAICATHDVIKTPEVVTAPVRFSSAILETFNPEILVIGASTGGPTMLETLFSKFKIEFKCPVVVVQHMPPVFTTAFAERLGKVSGLVAKEASHGEYLKNNVIYLAPGDYHLRLVQDHKGVFCTLDKSQPVHSVRPAVDPLFVSASDIYKNRCLGIVLTGMGYDGRDGAIAIKEKNGAILIQDRESSVVYGMPGAVFDAGAYDRVCKPDDIADLVILRCAQNKIFKGA